MICEICKQGIASQHLTVNGHTYHWQCYADEFDVPDDIAIRLLGKNPSNLKQGRLTSLMTQGMAETQRWNEIDHYKARRHLIELAPGCFKIDTSNTEH